ncbi:phosphotransferase [Actinoplanes lobatus]|uniref:phosphotransferase n=1 Tax=Actinoplanes lobatus TaxID=113568 RepID=UPI00227D74CE|nr:phosphotransferase [Actinoplanes lobatus]
MSSCTPLTQGLMNPNWRWETPSGTFVVKRLCDVTPAAVRRQRRILEILAAHGLPVPSPIDLTEFDHHWYAKAPLLPGTHRTGTDLAPPTCHDLGAVLAGMHTRLREILPEEPSSLPAPADVPTALAVLSRLPTDGFGATEIAHRLRLLPEIAADRPPAVTPGPLGWTHGDLTDRNLLFTGERLTGILDWDRLAVRPYGFELIRTAAILFDTGDGLDLPRVTAFLTGYRSRREISDAALHAAAHRRWWDYATDTFFLRRHHDHGDHTFDHLFHRSSRLLRWWTTHRADLDAAITAAWARA